MKLTSQLLLSLATPALFSGFALSQTPIAKSVESNGQPRAVRLDDDQLRAAKQGEAAHQNGRPRAVRLEQEEAVATQQGESQNRQHGHPRAEGLEENELTIARQGEGNDDVVADDEESSASSRPQAIGLDEEEATVARQGEDSQQNSGPGDNGRHRHPRNAMLEQDAFTFARQGEGHYDDVIADDEESSASSRPQATGLDEEEAAVARQGETSRQNGRPGSDWGDDEEFTSARQGDDEEFTFARQGENSRQHGHPLAERIDHDGLDFAYQDEDEYDGPIMIVDNASDIGSSDPMAARQDEISDRPIAEIAEENEPVQEEAPAEGLSFALLRTQNERVRVMAHNLGDTAFVALIVSLNSDTAELVQGWPELLVDATPLAARPMRGDRWWFEFDAASHGIANTAAYFQLVRVQDDGRLLVSGVYPLPEYSAEAVCDNEITYDGPALSTALETIEGLMGGSGGLALRVMIDAPSTGYALTQFTTVRTSCGVDVRIVLGEPQQGQLVAPVFEQVVTTMDIGRASGTIRLFIGRRLVDGNMESWDMQLAKVID